MELSVIIPVYKTEEYLNECICSILVQASQEVEVILVDDGSPDNSPQLCDEFMRADSRIKVIHKQNGGLSSARNAGLSIATGKYVTFIDSDDKIFPDAMADILEWSKSENADLCFLQAVKLYADGTQEDLEEGIVKGCLRLQKREDAIRHLASRPKYPGSAWAKLYRREFLLDNDLHFPYDRRYSEDLGFMRDCILQADSMDALNIPYYQYRQSRKGSITNKLTSRNFYDLLRFITESAEKLTVNQKAKDTISRYAMGFVAYEYVVLLLRYSDVHPEEKRDALRKLREYKWTLKFARNTKGRMVSLACSVFGVKLTSALLSRYKEAR